MPLVANFSDLAGKSVFITGGGAGIGAALTRGFVEAGANVFFVQRSDASELCKELEATYGNAPTFSKCDVTDTDQLKLAIDEAASRNGPVDILVNNAASDNRHALSDFSPDDWDQCINVNLRPHFFAAQAVAEAMKKAGGGSIINFSSISYLLGNAGYPGYMAAKAGIVGLTRALARELGPFDIRVNALLPGWVLTDRQLELWATPEGLASHLDRQCLKRHLNEKDIVEPTLFLASDASRMITGQALVVDGGAVVTG